MVRPEAGSSFLENILDDVYQLPDDEHKDIHIYEKKTQSGNVRSLIPPHVRESGFQIPDSRKFLLVPKNSQENFAREIRNTAQGIRNRPTNDWNPESKFHRKILESSTWNPESKGVESRIQGCLRFPYIGR